MIDRISIACKDGKLNAMLKFIKISSITLNLHSIVSEAQ